MAKHAESSGAGIDRLINGGELQRLIDGVDAAVSRADGVLSALDAEKINQAVESLKTALVNADKLVATLNTGAKPLISGAIKAANEAEATLISIRKAASEAEQTLIEFRNIASEEGTIALELTETMEQLSAAARSIRVFAEYLEQNPQALLIGKSASN